MTVGPGDLGEYIRQTFGGGSSLMIRDRDPESETGWRPWNDEDSGRLGAWIEEKCKTGRIQANRPERTPICHNLESASQVAGVGLHTIQAWIRRDQDPLPHFKEGRRILIPHFMLIRWLKEESERTVEEQIRAKQK